MLHGCGSLLFIVIVAEVKVSLVGYLHDDFAVPVPFGDGDPAKVFGAEADSANQGLSSVVAKVSGLAQQQIIADG